MTPENFVYWLQGFMEIGNPTTLNETQVQEIKNHITLVLKKETPSVFKIEHINSPYGLFNKNSDIFVDNASQKAQEILDGKSSCNQTAGHAAEALKIYKAVKNGEKYKLVDENNVPFNNALIMPMNCASC